MCISVHVHLHSSSTHYIHCVSEGTINITVLWSVTSLSSLLHHWKCQRSRLNLTWWRWKWQLYFTRVHLVCRSHVDWTVWGDPYGPWANSSPLHLWLPCSMTALQFGVQCLAQGHVDIRIGGGEDKTLWSVTMCSTSWATAAPQSQIMFVWQ